MVFCLGFLLNKFGISEEYLYHAWAFYDLLFPRYNSLDFHLERLFLP